MTKNHFETLGLKPGCTEDDIKKAYRTLAKKFHPDKNDAHDAEEKFKEIAGAYEVLKNEDRREIHEREVTRRTTTTNVSSTNGYSKAYRSETKNNYHDESAWSRKFGESSRKFEEHARNFQEHSKKFGEQDNNKYKSSTFGHFADEGKNSYREAHGKRSNKKSHQKPKPKHSTNSTNSRPRRPWSNEWTAPDDTDQFNDIPEPPPQRANFSFAFKSFMDDLGMSFDAFFTGPEIPNGTFGFSAFFDTPDNFTEFSRYSTPSSFNTFHSRPRPRKRNVAPEKGAEELDPEYMFTPRSSRPHTRHSATKQTYFADTFPQSTSNLSDDDDMDSRLFKCTYCLKRMPFSQLSVHEPGCALRHGGRFDVSEDEESVKNEKNTSDDIFSMGSPDEDQYPHNTGDWRQTHEELLKNIRKAKQAAQSTQRRYHSAAADTTSKETKEKKEDGIAQIKCKWCGRSFSHPAAKHHIPFCEKWTKDHGTPLNPADKPAARDSGSKNQKAKEYAKHIPKPSRNVSSDENDSPRSSRSHYDSFPNVGVHSKRETMNKPGAASGTGLHASFSHRDKSSSPAPSFSGTSRDRATTSRGSSGTGYMPSYSDNYTGPSFTLPCDDSYGFGLSGTKIKTEPRASDGCCPVCRKKYGVHGRFLCNCGVRKTGC